MPQDRKLSIKQQKDVQNLLVEHSRSKEEEKTDFDKRLNDMLEGFTNTWDDRGESEMVQLREPSPTNQA
jgi:hypothetical protein